MPSTKTKTPKASIDEIAGTGDADLDRFLGNHDRAQRDTTLNPAPGSRPLDVDALDARLRRIPTENDFKVRPLGSDLSEDSTPPYDEEFERMKDQTESYHELIRDGSRPLYSVHVIRDVYRHSDKYAEMLRPWRQIEEADGGSILNRQLVRWQDFRKWQNDNRGRQDDHGDFSAYVERKKRRIERDFRPKEGAKQLAQIEADPSYLKPGWECELLRRGRHRRRYRERGCDGFRDYVTTVKRRLARHGFVQSFELDEDPKKQDELTTWIEYLNYEYWWLDKYTDIIERQGPEHDRAWQELVDMKMIRPRETTESVRTIDSVSARQREENLAMMGVQPLQAEVNRIRGLMQRDPESLRISKAELTSRLNLDAEKADAAKRRMDQIQSRNNRIRDFVQETLLYTKAKKYAPSHGLIVQWVLDQVSSIESGMNPAKENRARPDGRRRTRRTLTTAEEPPERQTPKRVKHDIREPRRAGGKGPVKSHGDTARIWHGDGPRLTTPG